MAQDDGAKPVKDELYYKKSEHYRDWFRVFLQTVAGIVLAFGAYSAWQQVTEARTGQITDRFSRAVDQLGNQGAVDARVGGIYALERIAQDSDRDRQTVAEVVSAFIVRTTRATESRSEPSGDASEPLSSEAATDTESVSRGQMPPDLQAALTVVSRMYNNDQFTHFNLDGAYLPGVQLAAKANLSRASLIRANLRAAILPEIDLSNANLREANFSGATLIGADFAGAELIATDLFEAKLMGAKFTEADLTGADLSGADLSGATLTSATFRDACVTEETTFPDGFNHRAESVREIEIDEDCPGLAEPTTAPSGP